MRNPFQKVTWSSVERYIGVAALVLGLTGTIFSFHVQQRDERSVSCQSQINKEFEAVLKSRASISDENTKNINTLIQDVFTKGETTQEIQEQYTAYLKELAKINGELKRATYPQVGSC